MRRFSQPLSSPAWILKSIIKSWRFLIYTYRMITNYKIWRFFATNLLNYFKKCQIFALIRYKRDTSIIVVLTANFPHTFVRITCRNHTFSQYFLAYKLEILQASLIHGCMHELALQRPRQPWIHCVSLQCSDTVANFMEMLRPIFEKFDPHFPNEIATINTWIIDKYESLQTYNAIFQLKMHGRWFDA